MYVIYFLLGGLVGLLLGWYLVFTGTVTIDKRRK